MSKWSFVTLALVAVATLQPPPTEAGVREGLAAFAVRDYRTALDELLPLAESGDALSSFYIGTMLVDGLGASADVDAGLRWLTASAQRGYTRAQLRLAVAHDRGDRVPQDYRVAARWMAEAARGGNADAQFYLGQYYREGRGVVQDDALAFEWIRRSVEYDVDHERLLDALLYLGAACEWGRGLRQDLTEAYKWFSLAASYSPNDARMHDEAGRAMDALRIRMSAAQIADAGQRAAMWQDEKRRMYGRGGAEPPQDRTAGFSAVSR